MADGFVFSVQAEIEEATRFLRFVERETMDTAAVRALNLGIRRTNTLSVRELAPAIGVAQKYLRARMRIARATRSQLDSAILFSPRGFNPITLGFSPRKAQTFYAGASVGEAFAATMPNGSRQAVLRLPSSVEAEGKDSKGRPRRNRLPINSIRIRIGKEGIATINRKLQNEGREAFVDEFYRQLQLLVRRA